MPENAVNPDAVYLMWTSTQYSSLNGFTPNHFVPLMPVNKPQISLSNTITSECLPPQPATSNPQKRNISINQNTNAKKTHYQGSFTYSSHFNTMWTQQWPCIIASSKSTTHFYCTICQREILCAKQGVRDVKVHVATALHEKNLKVINCQKTLTQTCASQQNSQDKVC